MRAPALWLLPALGGCGNITNEVFSEDADFLAAFPGDGLAPTEPTGSTGTAPPELLTLSLAAGAELDDALALVLSATDTIRSGPPASREDEARTWGAYDWDGVDLSAAMQLTGGTRYDWSLTANSTTFATGSHYAGKTVGTGDGSFHWDEGARASESGAASSGDLEVTYDAREGVDLLVSMERWTSDPAIYPPEDASFAWSLITAHGDLQFRSADPPTWSPTDDVAESVVHTRWIEAVGGRSDAWVTGGGLESEDVWTQCWDSAGDLTYATDSLGLTDPVAGDGGESLCALHDLAPADRIE